ncbi:cysteine proteinase [Obba rivulosa]|uniref:Cysteine proteinase n=1 Tax=Obba rivulosa TaxID=1052685 RepID=A0A8E2AT33_9APHY|nr:cysteine proteinase [Obba rivulosa]
MCSSYTALRYVLQPLGDPAENTQQLTEQLRALGLYAAPTLGDGNCLFRALSDQYFGTPSYHLKLRQDICNWIEQHKERYAPFVDDERGLDVHLQCMRQPATYGGHLELSAFAHMMRRNVKVIQPGLVYVIEWAAGGDPAEDTTPSKGPSQSSPAPSIDESTLDAREKRRLRRERKRSEKEAKEAKALQSSPESSDETDSAVPGTIYVAYHDYEHFSSIRNLRGPHTGPPNVEEVPAPDLPPPSSPAKKKPISRAKTKPESKASQKNLSQTRASQIAQTEAPAPPTPSQIPLPTSRSPSPVLSSAPTSQSVSHAVGSLLNSGSPSRAYRSPKRTFDESDASSMDQSESSQGAAKRAKSSSRAASHGRPKANASDGDVLSVTTVSASMLVDEAEPDMDTPDLSGGSSPASTSSLSSVPSREPTPPPPPPQQRLTKRQRKVLGLPKPRAALVASTAARTRSSAGKIVIPGGRHPKVGARSDVVVDGEDEDEEDPDVNAEWRRNGTGRVDVRGFRELRI